MEITFQTKKESNQQQRLAFLSLSKSERFYQFIHLMELSNRFSTKLKQDDNAFKIIIETPFNGK